MNKIKQILSVVAVCAMIGVAAQVPQKINYQTVVRSSATGNPVAANTPVVLRFTIHDDNALGATVYTETTGTLTTNQFGLINTALGLSANLSSVDWSTGTKWLQVEADINNTGTFADMGTSQLNAVPYALYAANAPVSFSGTGTINYVPKFVGSSIVGNSNIFDNGNSIMLGGVTNAANTANVYIAYPNYNSLKAALEVNGPNSWIGFKDNNDINGYIQQNGSVLRIASYAGALQLLSSAAVRMTISPSGQIGVGTASPNADFEVGTSSGMRAAGIFSNASNAPSFSSGDTGTLSVYNNYSGSNYAYALTSRISSNAGYAAYFNAKYCGLRIDVLGGSSLNGYGGYFSVSNSSTTNYACTGTANGSSSTNYGVYGTASGGTSNYGVYCAGNGIYSGTWSSTSDLRLKKDISYLNGGLSTVMKLKPASYQFKTDDPTFKSMNLATGLHYGLIAQELEQVVPSVVSNNVHVAPDDPKNKIEYKGVNYTELIPIMINAIQEQQGEIGELKEKIKTLQLQLNAAK